MKMKQRFFVILATLFMFMNTFSVMAEEAVDTSEDIGLIEMEEVTDTSENIEIDKEDAVLEDEAAGDAQTPDVLGGGYSR